VYIWERNYDFEKSDLEILARFQQSVRGLLGLLFIRWQPCGAPILPSVLPYVFLSGRMKEHTNRYTDFHETDYMGIL
jgi:hypothetical protein